MRKAKQDLMRVGEPDIQSRILTVRGVQIMLDRDLAELYQVPTKALNQAVKRNRERDSAHRRAKWQRMTSSLPPRHAED